MHDGRHRQNETQGSPLEGWFCAQDDNQRVDDKQAADDREGVLKPEVRDRDKTGGERTSDRSECVGGVNRSHTAGYRLLRAGDQRKGQRKSRTKTERRRQNQRRDEQTAL